jgi:hypothetical protein
VFDPVSDSPEFHDLDSRTHGRTDALPVHYVFPQMTLDIDAAVEALIGASSEELEPRGEGEDRVEAKKGVIVVWDVAFDWLAGKSYRRVLVWSYSLQEPSNRHLRPRLRSLFHSLRFNDQPLTASRIRKEARRRLLLCGPSSRPPG